MTHEERAAWIRRAFLVILAVCIVIAAWFFPQKKPQEAVAGEGSRHAIEIIHFHLPNDPESEQIAEHLNKVEKKYDGQVLVTRVDVTAHPERAKAEKVTKPPKVVMMAGSVRACKFQGLWTQAQIERKVEEILRGLKRMGKDWRPEVRGMKPSENDPPAPP